MCKSFFFVWYLGASISCPSCSYSLILTDRLLQHTVIVVSAAQWLARATSNTEFAASRVRGPVAADCVAPTRNVARFWSMLRRFHRSASPLCSTRRWRRQAVRFGSLIKRRAPCRGQSPLCTLKNSPSLKTIASVIPPYPWGSVGYLACLWRSMYLHHVASLCYNHHNWWLRSIHSNKTKTKSILSHRAIDTSQY